MKTVVVLLLLCVHSVANAQDDRIGLTFGVQSGFEFVNYIEQFPIDNGNAEYEGTSTAIVATGSVEFDLQPMFKLPLFVAVAGGVPIKTFSSQDMLTETKFEFRALTQINEVEHEYSMFRIFAGYKFKPVFQPFVLFERALLQSTRWDLRRGTDEGKLILDSPNVTWRERVWSSHIGGGFQGGIPMDDENMLTARFRFAMLFPISSFVTNDHPRVNTTDGSFGTDVDGVSILSRLAMHYNWHERSSLQLGVNWYYRRWEGSRSVENGRSLIWPANDMDVIPVLLGITWSI